MEQKMSALQKLQEKIEEWKKDHEALKAENAELKLQLENVSLQEDQTSQIEALKHDMAEKDAEIEKIVEQVEALLG